MHKPTGYEHRERNLARTLVSGALLLPFAIPLLASFFITPQAIENRSGIVILMPPCLFHSITGRKCPTCGLSRAFCAISHGKPGMAHEYHPLAILWYGLFLAASIAFAISLSINLLRLYRGNYKEKPAPETCNQDKENIQ